MKEQMTGKFKTQKIRQTGNLADRQSGSQADTASGNSTERPSYWENLENLNSSNSSDKKVNDEFLLKSFFYKGRFH